MVSNLAFFGLGAPFSLILLLVLLGILAFEIAMFVSAIRNPNITINARMLWVVGMLLLHPFIAILYYFTDYKKAS